MDSLTPFLRHQLEDRPGESSAPEGSSSRASPPLGSPPEQPGQLPHPSPDAQPTAGIPMTDGTPVACHQKNAEEFLSGNVPGVMAEYAPGLFSTKQHTHAAQPAPDDDEAAVRALVEWREESPYG